MQAKDSATIAYSAEPQLWAETDLGNEPNDETKKIIKETDAGIDIAKFKDVKSFMEDLRK